MSHATATRWITISQQKHIEETLERFGKLDIRPISTPTLTNEHLIKISSPEINVKSYQSAIGMLMYLMLGTCPDLAYTVVALRRHSASPGEEHQHALDHVFQYLKATSNSHLIFQHGTPGGTTLHGFVNANWASDVNNQNSTLGFVLMLGGAAVSWSLKSKLQLPFQALKPSISPPHMPIKKSFG